MIVPSMATPCTGLGQGLTASMSAYMQGHTHPQQSVSLTLLPLTIIPSSLSVFKEIKSVLFVCITARVLLHACRGQLVGTGSLSLSPPCESQRLNSGLQAWLQAPLPTEHLATPVTGIFIIMVEKLRPPCTLCGKDKCI
jgi:hypothetical protein